MRVIYQVDGRKVGGLVDAIYLGTLRDIGPLGISAEVVGGFALGAHRHRASRPGAAKTKWSEVAPFQFT